MVETRSAVTWRLPRVLAFFLLIGPGVGADAQHLSVLSTPILASIDTMEAPAKEADTSGSAGDPAIAAAATIEQAPLWVADLDIYSDYVARGLSYSREHFSLQGHVEYDSPVSLYGGAYLIHNSEIINKETIEFDPYAGYLRRFNDWTVDLGIVSWLYPKSRLDVSRNRYNTLEGTIDVTYKAVGLKVWYDLRDYWGLDSSSAVPDYGLHSDGSSRGSLYLDWHVNLPVMPGLLLKLHAGHQIVHNYGQLDFTDWLIGLEKNMGRHVALGGQYTDTNANQALWVDAHGLKLARAKWTAYLRWSF